MNTYADFRPLFAEAMDGRLYTIAYLDQLVANMQAQCWFSDNACIVTEVKQYPTGALVIHCLVAAGDMNEIVNELAPRAEAWGRLAGCAYAMIESRAGWARALKPSGYSAHQQTLVKELA